MAPPFDGLLARLWTLLSGGSASGANGRRPHGEPLSGDAAAAVRAFLAGPQRVGLRLPDGWYGEPEECVLICMGVDGGPDRLDVRFATGPRLTLSGPLVARADGGRLVVSGFDVLSVDPGPTRAELDSGEVLPGRATVYRGGRVEFRLAKAG